MIPFVNAHQVGTCATVSLQSWGGRKVIAPPLWKPTFLKNESEVYEITSLSVCPPPPPPITCEPIGRFLWNSVGRSCHWTDLDVVLINPVLSTIPKWRTFKLLRWMQNLHQSTWDHEILYTDRSLKDEQLLIRPFLSKIKNTNMAAVWMLKINILYCGDNSWTIALQQMNFGIVRDHGHTYKFYLNYYFVWRSF
jgi:hypothetical protein